MSSNDSTPKVRPQRLRASCDGCFLAKVKCSKTRPICSRCLTCGIDCKYSPSSRAGKPRADATRARQSSNNVSIASSVTSEDGSASTMKFGSQSMAIGVENTDSPLAYSLETNWSTPSGSGEEILSRRSISANTTPMISEKSLEADEIGQQCASELFNPSFEWSSTARHSQLGTPFQPDNMPLPQRSKSLAELQIPHSIPPWFEDSHDIMNLPPHQNFSTTPPFAPTYAPRPSTAFEHPPKPPSTSCNCFTTCLQSLQALHNASSSSQHSPPFDLVLTVNRKAVSSCAALLSCSKCLSRAGSITITMLLATIIGKIMSFYRSAAQSYFRFNFPGPSGGSASNGTAGTSSLGSPPLPLTFGRYSVTGEEGRWLEMEILWRELRKLEGLCGKFGELCASSEGATGVNGVGEEEGVESAILGYLGRSLHFTFDILRMQEGYGGVGTGVGEG